MIHADSGAGSLGGSRRTADCWFCLDGLTLLGPKWIKGPSPTLLLGQQRLCRLTVYSLTHFFIGFQIVLRASLWLIGFGD